jgi:hypothetical protein
MSYKDNALVSHIASFVFNYIFKGNVLSLGEPFKRLVEYGFARFYGGGQNVIADEPLPLLAAAHHFSTVSWDVPYFVTKDLVSENDSTRGFAFDYYSAYVLGLAFKSPTRLSEVFEFIGPNKISDQFAQLVAVHKVDKNFVVTPVDLSSNHGPGYTLGYTCRTEQETLAWFEDPSRTVFCFPATTVGPDFLVLLLLSDGTLLRVLVQCKHNRSKDKLTPMETFDAFRTTDPRLFIAQRERKVSPSIGRREQMSNRYYVADQQMNNDLQAALSVLGPGTDLAGDLSVLRVLISHPAPPDLATIDDIAKADKSNHPAAILDVKSVAKD